jgi:hypothetical protein
MLSVIMLNVVMLNCVAPQTHLFCLLDDSLALLLTFVGVKIYIGSPVTPSSTYLGSLGTVMTRPVQSMCYDDKGMLQFPVANVIELFTAVSYDFS